LKVGDASASLAANVEKSATTTNASRKRLGMTGETPWRRDGDVLLESVGASAGKL
jgi:hypothetical protein